MDAKQIARARGWQTLADGAIVVALVAGVTPVLAAIQSADGWTAWLTAWQSWTWTAAQGAVIAGGTAIVSWLRRRWIQPADLDSPRRAAVEQDDS